MRKRSPSLFIVASPVQNIQYLPKNFFRGVIANHSLIEQIRGARANLREFGTDPISGRPVVVKDGRFGPYVTDGQTNASVPRSETVEGLTEERAQALLADRRDKAPAKRKPRRTTTRKTTARKTTRKTTR